MLIFLRTMGTSHQTPTCLVLQQRQRKQVAMREKSPAFYSRRTRWHSLAPELQFDVTDLRYSHMPSKQSASVSHLLTK